MVGQQKELLGSTNIMQLKKPILLEVKWKDASPTAKPRVVKAPQQKSSGITSSVSSGAPYIPKSQPPYKRKGKVPTKEREKAGSKSIKM